jgi:hypothetical protein
MGGWGWLGSTGGAAAGVREATVPVDDGLGNLADVFCEWFEVAPFIVVSSIKTGNEEH